MSRIRRLGPVLLVSVVLALTSCSSSAPKPVAKVAEPAVVKYSPPKCAETRPGPPEVVSLSSVQHDYVMTSFDGAQIRLHWFPLDHQAPTVLMGPGWSEAGATEKSGASLFGDAPIQTLQAEGYHVLTWDPRGFGQSTGTITVNSAEAEGRDVQGIIDWIATQPNVLLDHAADPRVGMVGVSYGGGIQLVTAAIDCRVDAIVPNVAWHSLATSLNKANTVKIGWSDILYSAAASRQLDPHITSSYNAGTATGLISPEDRAWFRSRGPGDLVGKIKIPTLFVHGTVDTLFTLDEAVTNYRILRKHGVPTAMLWYCGGHGVCLTDAGDTKRAQTATNLWLKRWLQRDTAVDTGPAVDIIDQHGARFTAVDEPAASPSPITATGTGSLPLNNGGGSGPAKPTAGGGGPIGGIATAIAAARATNAVNITTKAGTKTVTIVGAPMLSLTYSGTTPPGERPTRVFAQLVDDTTGVVLGNQITPIAVILDGKTHAVTVPLEIVAHTLAAGETVTLQLVASTVAYAPPRFGGSIDFTRIRVKLPVATGLTKARR